RLSRCGLLRSAGCYAAPKELKNFLSVVKSIAFTAPTKVVLQDCFRIPQRKDATQLARVFRQKKQTFRGPHFLGQRILVSTLGGHHGINYRCNPRQVALTGRRAFLPRSASY